MNKRKKAISKGDRLFDIINFLILAAALICALYPLIFVASASISDPNSVYQGKVWLFPNNVTLEGYIRVFRDAEIWTGYKNTIFYTFFGTSLNLLLTLPAAYALSRKDLEGRNIFMGMLTFTMFFSGGMIPTYLIIQKLGLINTIWVMIIPGAVSVWNIIITRTFFQSNIPDELLEAAMLDGCGNARFFLSIVLPLSQPIIAVIALYYGVGHWNAFFNALIYLSDRKLYPLQLILREILIQTQLQTDMVGDLLAVAEQHKISEIIKYSLIIVASVPVLMLYPLLQRYFVKGVMIGAIKG